MELLDQDAKENGYEVFIADREHPRHSIGAVDTIEEGEGRVVAWYPRRPRYRVAGSRELRRAFEPLRQQLLAKHGDPQVLEWEREWDGTYVSRMKSYAYIAYGGGYEWLIQKTGEHPTRGYAHDLKGFWQQIYREEMAGADPDRPARIPFGKPKRTLGAAKRSVEQWVARHGGP